MNDYYDVSLSRHVWIARTALRYRSISSSWIWPTRGGKAVRHRAIWPRDPPGRQPACATRWKTRMRTQTLTWWVPEHFWKAAVIPRWNTGVRLLQLGLRSQPKQMPFSTEDSVDHPVSPVPPPRKLMSWWRTPILTCTASRPPGCASYSLWSVGSPGYGAVQFTKAMLEGKSIDVTTTAKWSATSPISTTSSRRWFGCRMWSAGQCRLDRWERFPATSSAPYRVYNIGNSSPVELMDYITAWKRRWGWKRRIWCRSSREMCWTPAQTPNRCMTGAILSRKRQWRTAWRTSWNGTRITIRSNPPAAIVWLRQPFLCNLRYPDYMSTECTFIIFI